MQEASTGKTGHHETLAPHICPGINTHDRGLGGDSAGPSPEARDGWIAGESSTGAVTILHTPDGSTWSAQGESLSISGAELSSVSTVNSLTAWAAGGISDGYGVVVRTTDGGDTWEIVTPDSMHASGDDASGISLESADDAWVVLDYGNVWRTGDGGQNWTYQTVPGGTEGFFMLRISALDSSTAWVTGSCPTTDSAAAGRSRLTGRAMPLRATPDLCRVSMLKGRGMPRPLQCKAFDRITPRRRSWRRGLRPGGPESRRTCPLPECP